MIREMMFLDEYHRSLSKLDLAVVFFYAKWAPTCFVINPTFEGLARRFPEIGFLRVDIENSPEICSSTHIQGVPSFIFYKRGERVNCVEGAEEAELVQRVSELAFRLT